MNLNASWCSGSQLNGTFSLHSSLMGSASSDNLTENLEIKFIMPMKDCTCFIQVGTGISLIALNLAFSWLEPIGGISLSKKVNFFAFIL